MAVVEVIVGVFLNYFEDMKDVLEPIVWLQRGLGGSYLIGRFCSEYHGNYS